MGDNDKISRLMERLGVDEEAASALLVAGDGDVETALAVYVGYNGGDVASVGDLGGLVDSEASKRQREDDPESNRVKQQLEQRTPEQQEKIDQLKAMGFDEQNIVFILETNNWNVEQAVVALFG
mmetsp:Transcript_10851/g.16364  ORF Transcript_10851/g.16364 Transcript_10851/m.16364 type:complete len:124 (-) Transcript_10851:88-459(-)